MPLTASIRVAATATQTADLDLADPSFKPSLSLDLNFGNGTGANQADLLFTDERTLAASANEDLDLAGVLASVYGTTIINAKIKAIIIKAAAANVNNVRVTRPASNGFPLFLAASDGQDIEPGGFYGWGCPGTGKAVTAGTGDLLNIANSGAGSAITYQIFILGTSA